MQVVPAEKYDRFVTNEDALALTRKLARTKDWGYVLVNVNPCRSEEGKEDQLLFGEQGVLNVRFCPDEYAAPETLSVMLPAFLWPSVEKDYKNLYKRMRENQALRSKDTNKYISICLNFLLIFPHTPFPTEQMDSFEPQVKKFIQESCIFRERYEELLFKPLSVLKEMLTIKRKNIDGELLLLNEDNIDAVIQRLVPEYTLLHTAKVLDPDTKKGTDNKTLVVTDKDECVRAFRLNEEQIRAVNNIQKGHQLILACAGSGKSVILLAKCIKAAEMNPDKHFLLTCYGRNLMQKYRWMIDLAGLGEKNIELCTFNQLCCNLLTYHSKEIDQNADAVWDRLTQGKIKKRYYGIFIDEIQLFHTKWYQICYQLLEHKDSDDHLFIICGDRTQDIKKSQKRRNAPWNAGEGYPKYSGHTLSLHKNYRNSPAINIFVRNYIDEAKALIETLSGDIQLDPEMFMQGKSVPTNDPSKVELKYLTTHSNEGEARAVREAVQEAAQKYGVPYNEIAIITFKRSYRKQLSNWLDGNYDIRTTIKEEMYQGDVPTQYLYSEDDIYHQDDSGVSCISCTSSCGLDFEAVVVCGLKPMGIFDKTWHSFAGTGTLEEEGLDDLQNNINSLYVAMTRARRFLYIIMPESGKNSVYMQLLENAEKKYRQG